MIVYSNETEVVVVDDDSYLIDYPERDFDSYNRYEIDGSLVISDSLQLDWIGKLFCLDPVLEKIS